MFIRTTRVRQNGRTYRYAQLVESYRRDDGLPAHRVLYSFGRVDETLLANLRAAFRSAKEGQRLAPEVDCYPQPLPEKLVGPEAALRYLDLAVVLELFSQLGLTQLLSELLEDGECEVAAHKVVAALVAQRCVAPDSKLAATRWLPTTALPELLGVSPEQFNNTRVHRVLAQLEEATPELMRAVARRCAESTGGFLTLYMDITDTWFVGHGPELAAVGKTKEGLVRKKIGILLLCSEQGYPLRWEVLEGRRAEAPALLGMLRQLRQIPWLCAAPVVCDRALGHSAYLSDLLGTGLKFITAVAAPEMQTYYPELDELTRPLSTICVTSQEQVEAAMAQARQRIQRTGMKPVDETLFVLDAGKTLCEPESSATQGSRADAPGDALRAALEATEAVASGRFATFTDVFRQLGLDPKQVRHFRRLLTLPADIQERILAGEAAGQSAFRFVKLAELRSETEQRKAFERCLLRPPKASPRATESQPAAEPQPHPPGKGLELRVVVSFNPEVFALQRLTAQKKLESIRQLGTELNAQLAQPRCNMTKQGIERRVDDALRRKDLLQAFQLEIQTVSIAGKQRYQVELRLDEADWQRRRRTDGFSVLVAHPDVAYGPKRICRTYREKDAVETDFRVIKSQIQVRPVRHRSDLKVRAHVTLCMLALLVERALRHRFAKAKARVTAERALETLEPMRVCYFPAHDGKDTYLPTAASDEQRRLLRALKLSRLADPAEIAAMLTPRPHIVTTAGPESA